MVIAFCSPAEKILDKLVCLLKLPNRFGFFLFYDDFHISSLLYATQARAVNVEVIAEFVMFVDTKAAFLHCLNAAFADVGRLTRQSFGQTRITFST